MSTPLRRFIPGIVAAAPAGFTLGWNISASLSLGGPIDVDMQDTVTARQTWTNGNGDSVDAGWYSLDNPVLDDYDESGVVTDPRLRGRVYSLSDARPAGEWQIFCPAGTYRVWVGTGLSIVTNFGLWLAIKDATGAYAGTRYQTPLDQRLAIDAEEWANANGSTWASQAAWGSNYSASYYELTIPDRSGTAVDATGMTLELSKPTTPPVTWWWVQHMRIQQL